MHGFTIDNTSGIYFYLTTPSGAFPGFLKGGGGPISLGSLKKGHQILKGGVQWSEGGGGPVNLSHYDDKSCIFRC